MREHKTFADFWPYYLQEHSEASTRGWHYFGTILAMLALVTIVIFQKWMFLPLPMFCGYLFSWLSHCFIERNKPATFTYPLWSIVAELKMLLYFLTGKMKAGLQRAGIGNLRPASGSGGEDG